MAPFRINKPPQNVPVSAGGGNTNFQFYLDRLLKLIPAEVISLYLVGSGFIPLEQPIVLAIWAAVCLIGVLVVRAYGTADPVNSVPPQWGAVLISMVAFIILVYTLGGPFAAVPGLHKPYIGSLLVLAWTFFVPYIYKG